jgi:hypothetical protein
MNSFADNTPKYFSFLTFEDIFIASTSLSNLEIM